MELAHTAPQTDAASRARRARAAARSLAKLSNDARTQALLTVARAIENNSAQILDANRQDCREAEQLVAAGTMSQAMLARLRISDRGVSDMAAKVRDVSHLDDPLGRRLASTQLDDELILHKVSCPLGVVAIVFESRPEVVPQVASLALKSGNALLLKGGSEAARTNGMLFSIWREAISRFPAIPVDSIHLLFNRSDVMELLQLKRDVDLIIPRGSREFVEYIAKHSVVPVLGHGEGICHVYVDRVADLRKAVAITYDAKVQYPAACNAAETLLVHQAVAKEFLPQIAEKLKQAGVELRGCPVTRTILADEKVLASSEEDWASEYSDLILSIKVVASIEEALDHIHRYGSSHTETIVTEDSAAAKQFMEDVDAAGVFHNASTRFADGHRYGFGAEIGISNSKLHARGPMGMDGLTTYKYKLYGNGHTVAEYCSGKRRFKHRPLP
jgi:glutamate-5-semialdehyde dehydrogenase